MKDFISLMLIILLICLIYSVLFVTLIFDMIFNLILSFFKININYGAYDIIFHLFDIILYNIMYYI